MVITNYDFELALGDFLTKTSDDAIKNVLGVFDKEKTVPENIAKLKERSSGNALQDTISFLKSNSHEYPVAQHVLSCKNRRKEEYSRDIAKFLDFVKPTQCLSCRENYIPAAEKCTPEEPTCYLCQRPSHGKCYSETVIKPELGLILVCSECLSIKAAKDFAADINKKFEDTEIDSTPKTEHPRDQSILEAPATEEKEDCPLYLKRQCPHGLTGKREIDGNPCPYKHRKRCKYFIEYGPTGCRFGKKCHFLHPTLCQNSLTLKACLNKNCQEWHIEGTRRESTPRKNRNLDDNQHPTITTSNKFPPWMAESSQEEASSNPQNKARSIRQNPWMNNAQTPIENRSPPKADTINSRNFLERQLEEMKADLMSFIRTSITQASAVSTTQPQYIMMQPSNFSQPQQTQLVPVENWATNNTTNVQTAPQLDCPPTNFHQAANYQTQYPTLQQVPQRGGL